MDKKKIIEIVIVVVAFGGSAFVLYNGFFKNQAVPPAAVTAGGSVPSAAAILPYGSKMDFAPLSPSSPHPFVFGAVSYPALNASSEVGVLPQDLFK
jgi:hypothetical protein